MARRLFVLVICLLSVQVAAAQQSDCGNGLPCGSIPWPQPNPPQLRSPTPMPTIAITAALPTQTPGGPTATPTPTIPPATSAIDTSGIDSQFATLQAVIEATEQVVTVDGTPVGAMDQLDNLATDSYTFFSYIKAVTEFDLGGMTPLLSFVVLSLLVVISVKVITFSLPLLGALYRFIKSLIDIVLGFIP